MSDRKNFDRSTIESAFALQGGVCGHCEKSIEYGFEAHHKNGDSSDNSLANCELLCIECHDGELWKTLKAQKEATVNQLEDLIEKACKGEIAGALMDKALDAIKLKLSLQGQINNTGLLKPPLSVQLESYTAVQQAKQEAYFEGIKIGFTKALDFISRTYNTQCENYNLFDTYIDKKEKKK